MRTRALLVFVTALSVSGLPAAAQAGNRPLKSLKPPRILPHRVVTGKYVSANPGRWGGSGGRAYHFQWQRCDTAGGACADIDGATLRRLMVPEEAAGGTLRVAVTATSRGQSITAVSDPSQIVQSSVPVNTVAPTVSGGAKVGGRLHANRGQWTKTGAVKYTYGWQRCDASGAACVDLPGEEDNRYEISTEDIGSTLRVVVTVSSRSLGTSTSATSEPSAVVAA